MRRFLIKIAIFCIVMIGINLHLSQYTRELIFSQYLSKKDDVLNKKPKTLMLGDSHALPIKQEYLGDTIYNFAYHSESYADIYIKLRYVLDNGVDVKTLIIPADYHTLTKYRSQQNNHRLSIEYGAFDVYNDVYNTNIFKYYFNKTAIYVPMLQGDNAKLISRYFKRTVEKQFEKPKEVKKQAPVKRDLLWHELDEAKRTQMARDRFWNQYFDINSEHMVMCFDKIVELCQENDIRLIGVRFPVTEIYNEQMKTRDFSELDSIQEASGMEIYDFQDIYFGRDSLFRDQDHLNEDIGAKIFASKLIEIL